MMTSSCAINQAGLVDTEADDRRKRCALPEGRRILAVEDDDLMLEYLSSALHSEHYAVDPAQTCEEALRYALFRDYTIILMDLILPDGNGLQLFRQIARRRPALRSRVIFVTGALNQKEARRLSNLIGNPFIMKPFRLDELVAAVQKVSGQS